MRYFPVAPCVIFSLAFAAITVSPAFQARGLAHVAKDRNKLLLRFGTATRLAPIDRKLITFLYEHVPAGSEAVEVGQLFEKHW